MDLELVQFNCHVLPPIVLPEDLLFLILFEILPQNILYYQHSIRRFQLEMAVANIQVSVELNSHCCSCGRIPSWPLRHYLFIIHRK
jgi:hypothetical protein